jgi:hypothetical protein
MGKKEAAYSPIIFNLPNLEYKRSQDGYYSEDSQNGSIIKILNKKVILTQIKVSYIREQFDQFRKIS